MSDIKKIPSSVTDDLLHMKTSDGQDKVVLPITRYNNVMNAPKLISNPYSAEGAPFCLYETDEEDLDVSEIRSLINGLI